MQPNSALRRGDNTPMRFVLYPLVYIPYANNFTENGAEGVLRLSD